MSEVMKLKPEVKALWLAALRSGEYPQGREALQNKAGFCCLGVLCDLYQKNTDTALQWRSESCSGDRAFGELYDNETAYPPMAVYAWAFGDTPNFESTRCVELSKTVYSEETDEIACNLVGCNDELQLDFNQIADIIEEQL